MQAVLDCVWRLHWWSHPHGRAFEMLMCTLKARALKAQALKLGSDPPPPIRLDTGRCALQCGDDQWASILEAHGV